MRIVVVAIAISGLGLGCSKPAAEAEREAVAAAAEPVHVADVEGVRVEGEAGAYTLAVTIASPDTGCDRYANWWEIIGADGKLVYRRILRHSHVDDQPFTRDGGPVDVAADARVFVRAHMHPDGYGGAVMVGSAASGFTAATDLPAFDPAIESAAPQPQGCDR